MRVYWSYYFILFMSAQRYKSIYQFLKFSKHIWTLSYSLTFLVFQGEQKSSVIHWNSGQFYCPGKMPKMYQPHLKLLSLPSQKFLWKARWNLPTQSFYKGSQLLHWPNSIKTNTFKPPLFICLFIFSRY